MARFVILHQGGAEIAVNEDRVAYVGVVEAGTKLFLEDYCDKDTGLLVDEGFDEAVERLGLARRGR